MLVIIAGLAATLAFQQRDSVLAQRDEALRLQSLFLSDLATQQLHAGHVTRARLLALEALPKDMRNPDRPHVGQAEMVLHDALQGYGELAILSGHTAELTHVALSPNGRFIVTTSKDNTARLWNSESGSQIVVMKGHEDAVTYATFSPDSQHLITVSEDTTARLWDVGAGKPSAILTKHKDESYDVLQFAHEGPPGDVTIHGGKLVHAAFSHDGRRILTTSLAGTARLWDANSGDHLGVLRGHEGAVIQACFSPNDLRILTASTDGTARIWDSSTLRVTAVLTGHLDTVSSAAFSPDGKRVVTGSFDGTVLLWEVRKGAVIARYDGHKREEQKPIYLKSLSGRIVEDRTRGEVLHVGFSHDGNQVETTSITGIIRLLRSDDLGEIAVLRGHTEAAYHAVFSPDDKLLASGSEDGTARLWQIDRKSSRAVLRGHEDGVSRVAFSPDGRKVLTASADGTARIWGKSAETLVLSGHERDFQYVAFSPNGRTLFTASVDGTARLWDVKTLGLLEVFHLYDSDSEFGVLDESRRANARVVYGIKSLNGRYVLTEFFDSPKSEVRLWDLERGRLIAVLPNLSGGYATFDVKGDYVIVDAKDGSLRIWNTETGKEIGADKRQPFASKIEYMAERLQLHNRRTASTDDRRVFSPDGRVSIKYAGDPEGVAGRPLFDDEGLPLCATQDPDIHIWLTNKRDPDFVLRGHRGVVLHAVFSPNGQRLITAASDGMARLWDISNGSPLGIFRTKGSPIWFVAISPDGRQLATGARDGTVTVFSVFPTSAELIETARRIVPRSLSEGERRQFFLSTK